MSEHGVRPRKRVVYISQLFPYPPASGGSIKTLNTLCTLAKKYEVYAIFVSEERPGQQAVETLSRMGIHCKTFYLPSALSPVYKHLGRMVREYIHGIPHVAYKYYSQKIQTQIDSYITSVDPDIVHVCHVGMSRYITNRLSKKVYFLELENVETQLQWSRLNHTRSFIRRIYILMEGLVCVRYERNRFAVFDHIFTICDEDRQILQSWFGYTHVTTQRVVADIHKRQHIISQAPDILFIGSARWPPNEDAILWFTTVIFPIIRQQIPRARLHVVGRMHAPISNTLKGKPNIFLHGKQTDLSGYLARAKVFVLPFRMGGGIKLKALTAFTSGIPVVSTPQGMRGYAVRHNKECLIAQTPSEFAQRVIDILVNKSLSDRIVREAYQYARDHHSAQQNEQFLIHYQELYAMYAKHHQKT